MPSQPKIDALGQFELHPLFGRLGGALGLSQSTLFMVAACALVLAFLRFGMRKSAIVPGRLQCAAEMCYEFIANMAADNIGSRGRAYFPFVFALFFFILAGNYLGLLPFSFAYTSHIVVTFALAMTVFTLALLSAVYYQGFGFFAHFMPRGAPIFLAPLLVPIEILSWMSRPISLSVRLFANMVAGHVLLEVFGAFTVMLAGLGIFGPVLGIAPIALNVALMALELLVGALQAYVFAILTCIYLAEATSAHA